MTFKLLNGAENYRVYSNGKIEQLTDKVYKNKKSVRRIDREQVWKEVKPTIDDTYLRVSINGVQYYLHRVVASVWVENKEPLLQTHVHHIDESIDNNNADNLQWVTPTEHRGIHLLNEQKEFNAQRVQDDLYVPIQVRLSTRNLINSTKGKLTINKYLIKLMGEL